VGIFRLKVDTFRLKVDTFRLKVGIALSTALSSFKNIEPALKGRYPVLWRYRAYAPSKQVGRRRKGLTLFI
jgi:hypothetical protein